ncbi:MAG: hypothetical protein RTV31_17305, partial [Candidatus Thorarchaeota archaeon]
TQKKVIKDRLLILSSGGSRMHDLGLMLIDEKVRGISVSLTMTINDYFNIAKDIMKKNEYQRKECEQ